MEIRKCGYCSKTLPSGTHKRRKYCKGKQCKTRAYEKRKGITNSYGITAKINNAIPVNNNPVSIGSGANEMIQMLNHSLAYWEKVYKDAINGKYYLATISLGTLGAMVGAGKDEDKIKQAAAALLGAGVGHYIDKHRKQQIIADALGEIKAIKKKIKDQQQLRLMTTNFDLNAITLQNPTSVTGDQLANMKFDSYRVDGKYNELLGDVERGFNMAIFGAAGSGKSSVAIDFTANLKNHGRVHYFATEEGIGKSLQSKIERYKAKSPHVTYDITNDWEIIKSKIGNSQYVIFDSIERIKGITPDALNELYRANPKVSFISILQANKDGSYKGDSKYGHDVDIIWKVKKLSVWNDKNRYGGTGMVDLNSDSRREKVRT